ncbi:HEAT repeat domain-containing protein [Hyalangium rubrum]|uniref:HEAT repeat domain-containing protein n=1 Tax=Hyalangium rubrum TaxID=3103134 RepID=A0ABU5HI17_9BACT|nr:HEAT repeat domain-containing protein [Hyalangium sp. s54d21]MDY7233118.1 HEAT repeat domain-containing protein [Hyalangium sp. s54d21]
MTRHFLPLHGLPTLALTLSLLAPTLALAGQEGATQDAPALKGESCSVQGLMDQIRRGLGSKSEAYKLYLRTLLRESAVTLPLSELQAAFEREYDPAMAEHLAAALVARTERGLEPEAMELVAQRALGDRDPSIRAATVRALRRTGALERTGDMYERLIRDPSPEVRQEAATNLVEDNIEVYGGRDARAADTAVTVAAASTDPKLTAQILGNIMTGEVSAGSARKLEQLLGNDSAEVRAAASTALGGVPAAEMGSAREALVGMYRGEKDPTVRKAIIQSIARLGFSGAVPELQRLRGVDPSLAPEIDTWIRVLNMDLQEWSLILGAKQRLQQQAR